MNNALTTECSKQPSTKTAIVSGRGWSDCGQDRANAPALYLSSVVKTLGPEGGSVCKFWNAIRQKFFN
jgi:hypothetical protein